jgi:arginine repressor/hemolysin-activating ACP:hemolysin acyltransferase
MPRKKINDEHEGRILALLQLKCSQRQIVKILKKDGISVSQRTVSNVYRKIGLQRNSVEKIKFSRQRPASTPSTVSKVIKQIDVEDPPTQRSIAQSCHVSQSTVSRIIKSTNFVLRKKCKVQKLSPSNAEKRRQRAFRLYRKLANHRYKNFVTTDESWFYLKGTEGKRKVCYVKKNDPDYERMIIQQDSSRPKGFMVWAGISSRGKTSIRFVDPGTKIDSDYYIKHILTPFLSRDLPRLFPGSQKKKMIYHHDSAPSHVSKKTIAFMNEAKLNYVKPEEWMPKSPDAAPMDYAVWGYLKQRLNKHKIETLDELKKKLCMSGERSIEVILTKF